MDAFCNEATAIPMLFVPWFVLCGLVVGLLMRHVHQRMVVGAIPARTAVWALVFAVVVGFAFARQPQSYCMYGESFREGLVVVFIWALGFAWAFAFMVTGRRKT